jgi:hypothetical protein
LEHFSKKGFSFEKITDTSLKKEGHG